ncbi:MAG: MarR family winged helix-turn-helix transcriptional regulator [Ferruginibacter sp.]
MKVNRDIIPAIESIDPASCINSRLRRLARMATHVYERELQQFELRSSQISILMMVGKTGTTNQKEVADFLFIEKSTLSRDLKKLTDRKLIGISKGADARHSQLGLTKKGHELLEELIPAWKKVHDKVEKTLGSFSLESIDTITKALKQHTDR